MDREQAQAEIDGQEDETEAPENEEASMEALLGESGTESPAAKLSSGEVVWAKVIQVAQGDVFVDVGEKREGVVPASEFSSPQDREGGEPALPRVGQRIPVMRAGKSADGSSLLSYKKAKSEIGWQAACKAFAEKSRVRARVTASVKGGFIVDAGGVQGFLPASLSDLRPVRDPSRLVGSRVRCYILEKDDARRKIVLSRKAVLEEEASKRREKLMAELRIGEIRIGKILSAAPSGLLVDIGGAEGFVRAADVSWTPARMPSCRRGDKVRVKVLAKPDGAAQEGGKESILLGIKQLLPNPVLALKKKYAAKSVVRGKVADVTAEGGLKIVLDNGDKAFAAKEDLEPETAYKAGDPIGAMVVGVRAETLEVALSVAKFAEREDRKRAQQYLKPPPPLTLGELLSPGSGGE